MGFYGGKITTNGRTYRQKRKQAGRKGFGKPTLERSYAEVVKRPRGSDRNSVRVEVRREETHKNLRKLEHCIVRSWNPRSIRGEDLENLGRLLANS